jgi:hypothetical protein
VAIVLNRVGACRYRCFIALAMPRTRSSTSVCLTRSAGYSARLVEEFLDEEERNGFQTAIPEGCNFVVVSMDKAVMSAYRDRERAFLAAQNTQR